MSALYDSLQERLSDRDWKILESIDEFRYLTTRQVARLHFDLAPRTTTIPRTANLALGRLRELKLLRNLERRIGGVRAGSSGLIWQLTEPPTDSSPGGTAGERSGEPATPNPEQPSSSTPWRSPR
jgi:hypothetical protein